MSILWVLFIAGGGGISDAAADVSDTSVDWTGELQNLNYVAVTSQHAEELGVAYAQEMADALGVDLHHVIDMQGRPGHMTLSGIAPSSGTSVVSVPSTTTGTTTVTFTTTTEARVLFDRPLRGISYDALPCMSPTCGGHGLPSKDVSQSGYEQQWGAAGRDDLGTMAKLGVNSVRLYRPLGLRGKGSHAGFLTRAAELGLNVMPGFDTDQVMRDGECPDFDCFDTWKTATLHGLQNGFQQGHGWHPAVSMLILMNEPDTFDQHGKCQPYGDWCRVKAVLSAIDGVLAAEREAGVAPGRVKLSVTWSFANRMSIDGKVSGLGVFGFQDIVAAIADPQIAKYTPRSDAAALREAYTMRWVHGLNTRSPWSFVDEMVSKEYSRFQPIPWFIAEYGANGESATVIRNDLQAMDRRARDGGDFLGNIFFQFQTAYEMGGLAKNFGLFALGSRITGSTEKVCDRSTPCATWPVHCLTIELPWLAGTIAHRAEAVALAWGGTTLDSHGLCTYRPEPTLSSTASPIVTPPSSSTNRPDQTLPSTASPDATPPSSTRPRVNGMPPLQPMRGIAYGALPCTSQGCGPSGKASEDMLQIGYAQQWGESGRNDLGVMARLGANAVRLYHSFGMKSRADHAGFLDHAEQMGLNVLPGYHTDNANDPAECPRYDCFEAWKDATLLGFKQGFQRGDQWHPAVATLVLLNEPDFFETAPQCQPPGSWCRVKAALSALDGVLAAEKEMGVMAGRVRFTVTWSFAMRTSIDGAVTGAGTYGFQDMVAGIRDPQIAEYSPRSSLQELRTAFQSRWIHGMNTAAPWSFVRDLVSKHYDEFRPVPWFIGEYGGQGQDESVIRADLASMQEWASDGGEFLGAAFFQFQTTYWKGGPEMNFGLFGLGEEVIATTGEVCDKMTHCQSWPVHCLTPDLSWLPGEKKFRARAVASAWGGVVDEQWLCKSRRLSTPTATALACQITGRGADAAAQLDSKALAERFQLRSQDILGESSNSILGPFRLLKVQTRNMPSSPRSWFFYGLLGGVALLLVAGGVASGVWASRRKGSNKRSEAGSAEV